MESSATANPPSPSKYLPASGIPRTYSSLFSSLPTPSISLKKIQKYKGFLLITFTDDEFSTLVVPYRFTLIGTFFCGCSPMATIRSTIDHIVFLGTVRIGLLDATFFLIHFDHDKDYLRLFSRQSWTIVG